MHSLLPPHVQEQLKEAVRVSNNDGVSELERAKRVYNATERIKARYPHYFRQEDEE